MSIIDFSSLREVNPPPVECFRSTQTQFPLFLLGSIKLPEAFWEQILSWWWRFRPKDKTKAGLKLIQRVSRGCRLSITTSFTHGRGGNSTQTLPSRLQRSIIIIIIMDLIMRCKYTGDFPVSHGDQSGPSPPWSIYHTSNKRSCFPSCKNTGEVTFLSTIILPPPSTPPPRP